MVIIKPLKVPARAPIARAMMSPSTKLTGPMDIPKISILWVSNTAAAEPEMAAIAPTERSIPALRITMVCPTARIAVIEDWRVMFTRLPTFRK